MAYLLLNKWHDLMIHLDKIFEYFGGQLHLLIALAWVWGEMIVKWEYWLGTKKNEWFLKDNEFNNFLQKQVDWYNFMSKVYPEFQYPYMFYQCFVHGIILKKWCDTEIVADLPIYIASAQNSEHGNKKTKHDFIHNNHHDEFLKLMCERTDLRVFGGIEYHHLQLWKLKNTKKDAPYTIHKKTIDDLPDKEKKLDTKTQKLIIEIRNHKQGDELSFDVQEIVKALKRVDNVEQKKEKHDLMLSNMPPVAEEEEDVDVKKFIDDDDDDF